MMRLRSWTALLVATPALVLFHQGLTEPPQAQSGPRYTLTDLGTLGGGSAIYTSSSLQRHARDAEAVTHHFTVAPHTWEESGRVLLGREPIAAIF